VPDSLSTHVTFTLLSTKHRASSPADGQRVQMAGDVVNAYGRLVPAESRRLEVAVGVVSSTGWTFTGRLARDLPPETDAVWTWQGVVKRAKVLRCKYLGDTRASVVTMEEVV